MQPSSTVLDKRQVLGTRHRERTRGSLRRPEDAVRKGETVTQGGLHEIIFLRRSRGLNQCPECITKAIQLSRILLIYTGYVTAELRSAVSLGPAGVPAQANIRGLKCPIDLSKNNRR